MNIIKYFFFESNAGLNSDRKKESVSFCPLRTDKIIFPSATQSINSLIKNDTQLCLYPTGSGNFRRMLWPEDEG